MPWQVLSPTLRRAGLAGVTISIPRRYQRISPAPNVIRAGFRAIDDG
jgi:hypothetical protein